MMGSAAQLLTGAVVHQRVHPLRHRLRYRVFSVLVDLDRLEDAAGSCRLFSHNRWNLLSFHDSDLADGRQHDLAGHARDLVAAKYPELAIRRVLLLTYPRVLGYVFNPLSVYFCLDRNDDLAALVYEVSNTFGERISYVCGIEGGHIDPADKRMLVSPFNEKNGAYGFRVAIDNRELTVGVSLKHNAKPLLNTWYRAERRPFTDARIALAALAVPFMTLKVIAAIHLEAGKLWLKGLRPPRRGTPDRPIGSPSLAKGGDGALGPTLAGD